MLDRVQTLPGVSVGDGLALYREVALPWRALLAAALLALALGATVYGGFSGGRAAVPVADGLPHKGLLSLPLAARGPVSAALGGDVRAYRISAYRGSFTASTPAQHMRSSFASSGVTITSGDTQVGLGLRGVGYGGSLTALGGVVPRARGNRILYAHPGLSEWFANGPLGLEQGFTIAASPARPAAGPLTLAIALSGNAHAALGRDGQGVLLTRAGKTTLSYSGLTAIDARGRTLHSWLELHGRELLLRVDALGARYPLVVDPFIQQGAKLTGGGESGAGEFGETVALSADGDTALIGSPGDNGQVGAAWVFTRTGSTWTQQGEKLTGGGESGKGEFGWGALSADGNTALIGGPGDDGNRGAAWVFTRTGSTWIQQGEKLTGGGESASGKFGESVALSGDDGTALIGGPKDNNGVGAAWVFTRTGSTWTQQGAKLTGGGETRAGNVGFSVALSADGNTALVGGPTDKQGVGAAWVFTRAGEAWTQQGPKLTGAGEHGEGEFAWGVALSSDGDTALVGGRYDNNGAGAAWVFTRSGEAWTQQGAKLTATGESSNGRLGESVALSSDGDLALVGASWEDEQIGAAWEFTRSGNVWSQRGEKLTGTEEVGIGRLGMSAALSSDGETALLGGTFDHEQVGAVWAFVDEAEYGQCRLLNKDSAPRAKHGKYSDEDCQTLSSKSGVPDAKGDFEWFPGPAPSCMAVRRGFFADSRCETRDENKGKPMGTFEKEPGPGYTSTTGSVALETPGLGTTVVCAASTAGGEVTGLKTGVERITLTGCKLAGKECSSEGPNSTPSGKPGVIVTNLLDTRLAGPVSGSVLTELVSAEHQPYLFEFACEGPRMRTSGSLAGVQAGNVNVSSLTSTTTFAIGEGVQALQSEVSENGGISWLGPDPTSATTLATNTAAEKTEIKT